MENSRPLSAGSVIVSLVLGAHPRALTAAELVRAGGHFGVPEPTARVALTRAVAAGDLVRAESVYGLGPRLLARSERQAAAAVPWNGNWELTVVVSAARPSQERAALRQTLAAARLAELREGVWMRPANLARPLPAAPVHTFVAAPREDPVVLAATLWDLQAWARDAEAAVDALAASREPGERFALAAGLVRHLATDPLLPPELWPPEWPGPRAREAYAAFQEEVRSVLA